MTKLAEGMMHTKAGPDFDDDDVPDFGNFSSDDEAENRQTVNEEESGDLDEASCILYNEDVLLELFLCSFAHSQFFLALNRIAIYVVILNLDC